MNITDAVYNQWVEDNQYELEPSNITKVYRKFQQELNRTTVMTSSRRDDLWEAIVDEWNTVDRISALNGGRSEVYILAKHLIMGFLNGIEEVWKIQTKEGRNDER